MLEYDDLNKAAKLRALNYAEPPDDWVDCITEHFKEEGYALGFHLYESNWSVGRGQGDGASWIGRVTTPVFLAAHINKVKDADRKARYTILLELLEHTDVVSNKVEITRRSFYYNHSGTMNAEYIDTCVLPDDIDDDVCVRGGILDGASIKELMLAIDTYNLVEEFLTWIEEEAREYADEMYKALEREYDSYYTEEYLKDLIYINGWRFDESGQLTTSKLT